MSPDDKNKPPAGGKRRPEAEVFSGLLDDDFDFAEGESLGEMLGAPPPLPPPEDEVLTSAPRPARAPSPTPEELDALARPKGKLPPPPTDDEIFGMEDEEPPVEVDAAFDAPVFQTQRDPRLRLPPDESSPGPDDFGGSTRVASVEASALAVEESAKAKSGKRGPAVVRRDQLPKRDDKRPRSEFDEHAESTRIANLSALEQFAGISSRAPEPEVEARVELDEDFYDGIEVSSSEPEADDEPEQHERHASPSPASRRLTQNVVRRPSTQAPQPAARKAAAKPVAAKPAAAKPAAARPAPAGKQAPGKQAPSKSAPTRPVPVAAAPAAQAPVKGSPGRPRPISAEVAAMFADVFGEPVETTAGKQARPADVATGSSRAARHSELADGSAAPSEEQFGSIQEAVAEEAEARAAEAEVDADDVLASEDVPAEIAIEAEAADEQVVAAPEQEVAPPPLEAAPPPIERRFIELAIDPSAFRFPEAVGAQPASRDDHLDAVELWERELAIADGPTQQARLRVRAARAAEQAGDLQRARDHVEEAAHLDPDHLPAIRAARRLSLRLGDFKPAIRWLDAETALVSAAERAPLAAYGADLLIAIGEQDLARVVYGELSDAKPDDLRSLLARIELAFADERDDELGALLDRAGAIIRDPWLAAAFAALRARLHEQAGALEQAEKAWLEALESDPHDRGAILALGRLCRATGREVEAAEWNARLVDRATDPALRAAIERARGLVLFGDDPASAIAPLAAAAEAAPNDALVLEALAGAYETAGRSAEAVEIMRRYAVVESNPGRRAEALRRTAALQAELGDQAASVLTLGEAATSDPTDVDSERDLEAAAIAAGDLEGAAALLRSAAEANAADGVFERLRAARILAAANRPEDVVTELEAARVAAPDSVLAADALARALESGGRVGDAAQVLAELAAAGRSFVPASELHARRARLLESTDEGAAAAAWNQVLESDPAHAVARTARVALAARVGDGEAHLAALAAQQEALAGGARATQVALTRAALLVADDPGAAEAALDAVLARDASEPRAAAFAITLAGAAGRWRDVARRFADRSAALSDGPEKDALRYRAAATLIDREGDDARGAELLAPLRAARPSFAGAEVLLEKAQRGLGDARALAEALARQAGLGEKGDASPIRLARLIRLAEVLEARVGDPRRAAQAAAQALDLAPDDPRARETLRRVAPAADQIGKLSDLALADLGRAEQAGDAAARAAVYEELAWIDGDLRGDVTAATIAWEAAADLDPMRVSALRVLERSYLAEGRSADLATLYARLAAALGETPDAAAAQLERARLHDLAGERDEANGAWSDGLALDSRARMALFRLEAHARDSGDPELHAAYEDAVAGFFGESDPRACAAFLTRAGEIQAEQGRDDEGIMRFRTAADVVPGYTPALRAWRRVALRAGRWAEVVEAVEREAAAAIADPERAVLYHLAGVTAMDQSLDGEAAATNFRRVLAIDPEHVDAFPRLRRLLEDGGRHEELAQLLLARVEIERDRGRAVELHRALARLHREHLSDHDRAKAHLRAVLTHAPGDLAAQAQLADIAWELEQWSEAAEALIARAKLEKDPTVLKNIFYRLGLIYADKLPDRRWALKSFERVLQIDPDDQGALEQVAVLAMQGGDWRLALGAAERLATATEDDIPARIGHLHRIGQIQEEGFQDRKRAEEAYRRALDLDPASTPALDALVDFYGRQHDMTSLRVHIDRVAGSMRNRLVRDPLDGPTYHVLARTLAARARAGFVGSIEAARCAAEIAHALGAADDEDRALAVEAIRQPPNARGLGSLDLDETLFHPSIPNGFRQIFRLLFDTLSKRYAPDLRRWGVSKNDRLHQGHPVRDIAVQVAADLGLRGLDVYLSSAQPDAIAVELTDPISLVVGPAVCPADKPAQIRFVVGRALKLATSYLAAPARLTSDGLGVLLAAVIRQYDPAFQPPGVSIGAVSEEQQRLARLIPNRLRHELMPFASEISGVAFDHHALWMGIQHTADRAGLVVSGSALSGLAVLLRLGGHRDLAAARSDGMVTSFLRYAVSDEHCEIRKLLAQ